MSQNVTVLTQRQRQAMQALLEGKTVKDAAEITKISRKTLYTWLGQPVFRAELDRLGGLVLEEVSRRMITLSAEAVKALAGIMKDKKGPVFARIQAASAILKHSPDYWELSTIGRRIEQLETLLNDRK